MKRILLVAEIPDDVKDVQRHLDAFRASAIDSLESHDLTLYRATYDDVNDSVTLLQTVQLHAPSVHVPEF